MEAALRFFPLVLMALELLICAGATASMVEWARADVVVATSTGDVQGVAAGAITTYLGIPYAAPPVGDLRWRPPQAPAPWTATRKADAFGSRCPQTAAVGEFSAPSATEDCLFLNVFVPSSATAASRLPVMFWIPGGGFFAGGSNDYDPASLVTHGGVVVVSINYRLGLLGFLSQRDLDAEGHAFANYGLMDQQLALHWVHDNIARFGGDPDNVTIFGESAGAISAYGHMASPQSKGLFHKAILESGYIDYAEEPQASPRSVTTPLDKATGYGAGFAAASGCKDDVAACLRRLPVAEIIARQMPFISGLIIGGSTLPRPIDPVLREGSFNRVPVINGTNHDEWRWPLARTELNTGRPLTTDRYAGELAKFFGAIAPKVAAAYEPRAFGSASEALAAAETDAYFACAAIRYDGWMARYVPVYGYEFDDRHAPMYMPPASFPYGAAHTSELQFIFPMFHGGRGIAHPLTPAENELALTMARYWSNFARNGDPNGAGLPTWPRVTTEAVALESLNVPAPSPIAASFNDDHKCAFWRTVLP